MMRMARTAALGLGVAACLVAAPTSARVDQTIYLRGYVPVYCNVDLTPEASTDQASGIVDLGISREACNAPRGYRIILDHPAGLADAAIISDATRIPLSASGETVLVDADGPGLEQRHLALDLGEAGTTIARLGLRIEVKY